LRTSRRGSDLPFRWFDGQRREHPGPLRCSARSRLESSCSTATAITKVPPKKRGAAAVANPRLVGRCQSHFGFNERDPTRQLAASQRAGGGREGASSTSLRAGASADRGGELRRLQPQGCSSPKAGANAGSRPQHRNHRGDPAHHYRPPRPGISCRFFAASTRAPSLAPTSNLESFNLKRFMSVSSSEPASL
jgi:hypothetical protein